MDALPSHTRGHIIDIHSLAPLVVRIGQSFAYRACFDQVEVDVIWPRLASSITELVQSLQKIPYLQERHGIFSLPL